MRLAAILAFMAGYTVAFAPNPFGKVSIHLQASNSGTVCEIPSEFENSPSSLVGVPNGANAIRSAVVTDSAGNLVRIDDVIQASKATSNAPHIVIYLRHMG